MTDLWADFNGTPPGAASLRKAGFTGVIRYIGLGSSGKRIHAAEYEDYSRNGMPVLLVAELHVDDAWAALDDYAMGFANGQAAVADAREQGIPDYVGIACAADAHASSASQVTDAVEYARGFAAAVGTTRAGFYGFQETSRAVYAAGVVSWHWRCGAEPGAEDQKWVHFWQRNTTIPPSGILVGGTVCDINEVVAPMEEAADMTPEEHQWLQDIHGQTAIAYPTWNFGPDGDAKTLVDQVREVHRQVCAAIDTQGRPVDIAKTDNELGHLLSMRAELAAVAAAITSGGSAAPLTDNQLSKLADMVVQRQQATLAAAVATAVADEFERRLAS